MRPSPRVYPASPITRGFVLATGAEQRCPVCGALLSYGVPHQRAGNGGYRDWHCQTNLYHTYWRDALGAPERMSVGEWLQVADWLATAHLEARSRGCDSLAAWAAEDWHSAIVAAAGQLPARAEVA